MEQDGAAGGVVKKSAGVMTPADVCFRTTVAAIVIVVSLVVVGVVYEVSAHRYSAMRACENKFEMNLRSAHNLLASHCQSDGGVFAQSDECVHARETLAEDRFHAAQQCYIDDVCKHLGTGDPYKLRWLEQQVFTYTWLFGLLGIALVGVVIYTSKSAVTSAAETVVHFSREKKRYLPTSNSDPPMPVPEPTTTKSLYPTTTTDTADPGFEGEGSEGDEGAIELYPIAGFGGGGVKRRHRTWTQPV